MSTCCGKKENKNKKRNANFLRRNRNVEKRKYSYSKLLTCQLISAKKKYKKEMSTFHGKKEMYKKGNICTVNYRHVN